VRDKTIDHCKKWANSKKNEIKKLENELKYLEELSNTGTQIISTSHGMTGRNFFDVFLPFYLLFGF
jgi:superfamily I DNA/RNA helicase